MPKSQFQEVLAIAEDNDGLIPTAAARAAGINPNTLVKMASRGRIQRVFRGVYRLPGYPALAAKFADYRSALAWAKASNGPKATISHESALALFGISDALPSRMHITIPENSRFRHRPIPSRINVHKADLAPSEITLSNGIPVTTVDRTIEDVIQTGRIDLASAALEQAIKEGYLTKKVVSRLRKRLNARYA